ncbi:hypothetical protein [Pseudomonas phage UF_RH7]|nr:hypothetical protein [Pseudomonas phage UF_RH7]
MSNVQDMAAAPTDGTCVLILTHTFEYDRSVNGMVRNGNAWVECRFVDGRWREWCGNKDTFCTSQIAPIKWAPLPEPRRDEFKLSWLGPCKSCGFGVLHAFTTKGNAFLLFEGDEVQCPACSRTAEVRTEDGCAFVDWGSDDGHEQ